MAYRALFIKKRETLARYRSYSTDENKVALRSTSIALRDLYERLKRDFYSNVIASGANQPRNFYKFVSNFKKPKGSVPATLIQDGISHGETVKYARLAAHLFKSFTFQSSIFSNDDAIAIHEMKVAYSRNYSNEHETAGQDIDFTFTNDDVIRAINELKDNKEDGPMGISVSFVKYHRDKSAGVLMVIFNRILRNGLMPSSWKLSYLTPIPKKG